MIIADNKQTLCDEYAVVVVAPRQQHQQQQHNIPYTNAPRCLTAKIQKSNITRMRVCVPNRTEPNARPRPLRAGPNDGLLCSLGTYFILRNRRRRFIDVENYDFIFVWGR